MASSSSSSEAAAPPPRRCRLRPRFGAPSSISLSHSLDSTLPCPRRTDGMCACKSPISFAHFLHFKIRSAKEGEREGVSASKMGPRTLLLPMLMPQTHHKQRLKPAIWGSRLEGLGCTSKARVPSPNERNAATGQGLRHASRCLEDGLSAHYPLSPKGISGRAAAAGNSRQIDASHLNIENLKKTAVAKIER